MHHSPGHQRPPQRGWGRRALAVFESALDAVVCVDDQGAITSFNASAAELMGWDRTEVLGQPAGRLLAGGQPGGGLDEDIERILAGADPAPKRVERAIVDRHGHARCAEVSITTTEIDGRRMVTLFLRDVSDAKRTERRREIEHRLARVLAAARSGEEIARGTLEMLGTGLGFDHAELWLTDERASTLRLSAAWRRAGGAFGDAARGLVLARDEDLAGLAVQVGETVCSDDAASLEGLIRADAVQAEGIHGCAALPIRVGRSATGALVLARRSTEPLDPELRQTLHSIAVQLGHFAERRAAERRLAEETVALAAVARATRRLTDAVDRVTAGQAICAAAVEACGAAHAFLALPDPEHGGLVVCAAEPGGGEGVRFGPDALGAALRAFQTGHAAYMPEDTEAEMVSGLLQPIFHDDQSMGVLGVGWTTSTPAPDRTTMLLIRLLAAEAGSAISRVELVARLEAAARTDPLTGLANVRAWEEQLSRELAASGRTRHPVAIAVLDIDGFKVINDRLGHEAGDRVLRSSAAAWQAQLRGGDLLARLGGDEFAILLPRCPADDAMRLADRLRAATQEATASIGVASWDGQEPVVDLMRRADAALYAAKAAGRDQVAAR